MTKQEQLDYLVSTGLYNTDSTLALYYEGRMMDSKKTIPIAELVEHLIDVDKYFREEFYGEPHEVTWNIRQILNNIDMIVPVEDRESHKEVKQSRFGINFIQ